MSHRERDSRDRGREREDRGRDSHGKMSERETERHNRQKERDDSRDRPSRKREHSHSRDSDDNSDYSERSRDRKSKHNKSERDRERDREKDRKHDKDNKKDKRKSKSRHKDKERDRDDGKKHSKREKEKDKERDREEEKVVVAQPISGEDFFAKNHEYRIYLKLTLRKNFEDLSTEDAHKYFNRDFVKDFNAGRLDKMYYTGDFPLELKKSITHTQHKWSFKLSHNDEDQLKDLAEDVDFQSNSAAKELLAKDKKPQRDFRERDRERGGDSYGGRNDRGRDDGKPSHYGPG